MNINFQEEIDLLAKVRVVLGNINIEAKSAAEVVSIDRALNDIIESLSEKNKSILDNEKQCACACEKCENAE
jgi:hypothetical protein